MIWCGIKCKSVFQLHVKPALNFTLWPQAHNLNSTPAERMVQ